MRFGSGWAPAPLVDSLTSQYSFNFDKGADPGVKSAGDAIEGFKTGRRLVMFGPEGFREAPKDHRLVIVMGVSPEGFFEAIDKGVAQVAKVRAEEMEGGLRSQLLEQLIKLNRERLTLVDRAKELAGPVAAKESP